MSVTGTAQEVFDVIESVQLTTGSVTQEGKLLPAEILNIASTDSLAVITGVVGVAPADIDLTNIINQAGITVVRNQAIVFSNIKKILFMNNSGNIFSIGVPAANGLLPLGAGSQINIPAATNKVGFEFVSQIAVNAGARNIRIFGSAANTAFKIFIVGN